MSKLGFMQDLIRGIKKIVASDEQKTAAKEWYKSINAAYLSDHTSPETVYAYENGVYRQVTATKSTISCKNIRCASIIKPMR